MISLLACPKFIICGVYLNLDQNFLVSKLKESFFLNFGLPLFICFCGGSIISLNDTTGMNPIDKITVKGNKISI